MVQFFVRGVIVAVAIGLLSGCSEENTTQYIQSGGAIYGRVESAETGISIQAWQAVKIKETVADDEGYFTISDLDPGRYLVKIVSPAGRKRELPDVDVDIGRATDIGLITFSTLPWPLTSHAPGDGDEDITPLGSEIELRSEVPLDMESLDAAVTIDPPIDGEWRVSYYYSSYSFVPAEYLRSGTEYVVTLSEDLRTTDGEIIEESYSFSFSTESMRMQEIDWDYYSDHDDLSPYYRGDIVDIRFNVRLNESTFADGISITPALDFEVRMSGNYSYSTGCEIYILGNLLPATTYSILFEDALLDLHGDHLPNTATLQFTTAPFRIESADYPSSRYSLSPRFDGNLATYSFNMAVDLASAQAAIAAEPPSPLLVQYYYSYDSMRVVVSPAEALQPGTDYELTIAPSLAARQGATLGVTTTETFRTQELEVTDFRLSSYSSYYSSSDSVIDPGSAIYCRVYLNADVDQDSFNVAASFEPEIEGFWYLHQDYSSEYMDFFTTAVPDLAPEQVYTFTLDGSVPITGSAGLGEDFVRRFRVRPVSINAISPEPGSRNAYSSTRPRVEFNTDMDRATVESAFELTLADGTPVEGTFNWYNDDEVEFRPSDGLQAGKSYFISVAATAASASGHFLKEAGFSFFSVQ